MVILAYNFRYAAGRIGNGPLYIGLTVTGALFTLTGNSTFKFLTT